MLRLFSESLHDERMTDSPNDRHRDHGYLPCTPWTDGQRAYMEDFLTSVMTRAEYLEREARRLKIRVVSALTTIREAGRGSG